MTDLERLELILRRIRAENKQPKMLAIELVDILIEEIVRANNERAKAA